MIVDALLDIAFGLVAWLVGLLPVVEVDCSGLSSVGSYLTWVGLFVDLGAWSTVLGVIISVEATVLAVQAVVWLWHQIPFKAS